MVIRHNKSCGTLESNDALVTVSPGDGGLKVEISSIVMIQYGAQIRKIAFETLDSLGVSDANVYINDHGALDCVLRARIETAILRAAKEE